MRPIVRGFILPSPQRPETPLAPDAFDDWVVLTTRWDAAYKDYFAVRNARAAAEAASGTPDPELKRSEDEALAVLAVIKAEMDKVVAHTRQRRRPLGGSLVIGTIGNDEAETSSGSEDDPGKK
ncbi:hypothetical protein [Aminobacter carboxidus]|uniref:Uncharacterized protein n=1 Tax=Aminobacter carboxidus TaxID=376165 RepID=A0ABR9GVI2_9HYPH|nr:hypothetical protein [Aminobacter carboxidus]MBE1207630.1 hypothetical protein [Aminobacter carboxidus]